MNDQREGWYWVSQHEPPHDSWEPVWFDGKLFHMGDRERWGSSDFGLIGPRIPTPDEPFKCVPVEPTAEMVDAASEAYMPFGDMALAIQAAIAYAPDDQ